MLNWIIILICFTFIHTVKLAAQSNAKPLHQRLYLDKMVDAGQLKLLQSMDNPNEFYYLPSRIELAKNATGIPEFSFIKYVKNQRTTNQGGNSAITEAQTTGGIVHLLVALKVQPDVLDEAKSKLRFTNPGAVIKGPVFYEQGTMELICEIASGGDSEKKLVVAGIGPAPTIEGDKVAVSFRLDGQSATILEQSLKMPIPQISFNFDMQINGFQSPRSFNMTFDWDKVYKHKIFEMGIATPIGGFEIAKAVEEMRSTGAIKVVDEINDPDFENKWFTPVYNKLLEACFQPVDAQGMLAANRSGAGGKSYLDRATEALNNARNEQRSRQQGRRSSPPTTTQGNSGVNSPQTQSTGQPQTDATNRQQTNSNASNTVSPSVTDELVSNSRPINREQLPTAVAQSIERDEQSQINNAVDQVAANIQVYGTYQIKEVRQKLQFTIDAKKVYTATKSQRFGGNIGRVNCSDCIREINLDDNLYKQNEIQVTLSNVSNEDFSRYLNSVSVTLRKKHAGGDVTIDNVVISRANFSKEGNYFTLMYGWKNDRSRDEWLKYDYKVTYNYANGLKDSTGWKTTTEPIIALVPSLQLESVTFELSPTTQSKKYRSAQVAVSSTADGINFVRTNPVTLDLRKEEYGIVNVLMNNKHKYKYEYSFRTVDGEMVGPFYGESNSTIEILKN